MHEDKLIALAGEVVTGEEVLGAGVLAPSGTAEGALGALAVGGAAVGATGSLDAGLLPGVLGGASGRAASVVGGVPRWTLVAVTPATVHLIAVRSVALPGVAFSHPRPWRAIDRSRLALTVHLLPLALARITLTDLASGEEYRFESSASAHSSAHADVVLSLLQSHDPAPAAGSGEQPPVG